MPGLKSPAALPVFRRRLTYALTGVLLSAIALVACGALLPLPAPTLTRPLRELLPPPPPGWTVSYRPIADTPEMQAAVTEVLNYDDAVLAEYSNGTHRISVYAAHWRPGKMSHRLIAGHTPDVCWVGAGWTMAEKTVNDHLVVADRRLVPAQQRAMLHGSRVEHVLFWHLLDGRTTAYGLAASPPWHAFFSDLAEHGLRQRREQLFVRISSPQAVATWTEWSAFGELAAALKLVE